MKKILIGILIFLLSSITIADELRTREEIKNLAMASFISENFETLNSKGTAYLERQSRTSSGLWNLTLFNAGLSRIPNSKVTDPKYWSDLKAKVHRWTSIDEKLSFSHMVYVDVLISEAWMYRGMDGHIKFEKKTGNLSTKKLKKPNHIY